MFRKILIIGSFIIFITLVGCGEYQKIVRSDDVNLKYEKAVEYYKKGDYFKSMQLFDELIILHRGTSKAEKIYYYYAYSYYGMGDFYMASHHFKNLARTLPSSSYAEECLFMGAYCNYLESPESELDQTVTKEAIKQFQLFVNKYPQSERIDTCNVLMDELRFKLETKTYKSAYNYYYTLDYKSATYSLNSFLKKHPDSYYKEEALFYLTKAHFYYADSSIESKQKERYKETVKSYENFILLHPQSKYIKELASIYKTSLRKIEN